MLKESQNFNREFCAHLVNRGSTTWCKIFSTSPCAPLVNLQKVFDCLFDIQAALCAYAFVLFRGSKTFDEIPTIGTGELLLFLRIS